MRLHAGRDPQQPLVRVRDQAPLFVDLRAEFPNLIGFEEFGGADSLTYAAGHITSGHPDLSLMVGVATQVFHGIARRGGSNSASDGTPGRAG